MAFGSAFWPILAELKENGNTPHAECFRFLYICQGFAGADLRGPAQMRDLGKESSL